MEQRIIPLKIAGERVTGAGVTIGAVGSHDEVLLEMDFRPSRLWVGTTRRAIFSNALGEERTVIILTTDRLAEGQSEVYLVPVPQQAKTVAGECFVTVEGYVADAQGKEIIRCVTEEARFRVLPSKLYYNTDTPLTPSQLEQLQTEIDSIKADIVDAAKAADAKEAAQAAQTAAEEAQTGAETAATQAQQSAAAAQGSQTAADQSATAAQEAAAQARQSATAAQTAQAGAEAAEEEATAQAAAAQAAQTAAQTAQTGAQTAASQAQQSAQEAATAATQAAGELQGEMAGYISIARQLNVQTQFHMLQASNARVAAESAKADAESAKAGAKTSEEEAAAQADRAAREADRAKQAAGAEFLTAVDMEDELADHLLIGEAELMKTMPIGGALFVTDGEAPEGLVTETDLDKSWEESY